MNRNELFEIVGLAFRNAFKGKIWKYFAGSLGGLVALLLSGQNFFKVSLKVSILIGCIILILIFIARFAYFTLKGIVYTLREAVYGKAIIILKDTFALIHFLRKQNEFNDKLFMETMTSLCNNLKIIFDNITNADCSVSIKVSRSGPITMNTIVENLCRDSSHSGRDTIKYIETKHRILGNTPFLVVLNNVVQRREEYYYLNNSISTTTAYQNTSSELYPNGKLPYESELVYPIVPIHTDSSNHENAIEIWGFICIDCNERNKLINKYNPHLIAGVADGIYDVILNRNKHFNK